MKLFDAVKEYPVLRRSVSLLFHLVGVFGAFVAALLLRFDFEWTSETHRIFTGFLLWMVIGFMIPILGFRLYRGLWRFFTLRDCFITGAAVFCGLLCSAILVFFANSGSFRDFPRSSFVVTALILLCWEVGSRGMIRLVREHRVWRTRAGRAGPVLLIGNPDDADSMIRNLQRYPQRIGKVMGLVSHTRRHRGQQLRGVRIYGVDEDVSELVRKNGIESILFLPPLNSPSMIREVMWKVSRSGQKCEYRFIPSMEDLASGKLGVEQMRRVSIEDLLLRPTHAIDLDLVSSSIAGKKVMVTGAGGSIGSEICRQLLDLGPESLTLFESSEYLLFEIDRELAPKAAEKGVKIFAVTGDVKRSDHVSDAIDQSGGVDVIYHAAAYKHVPLMERNPLACFQNNVLGTRTVASIAEERGVSDFVLISTDKAVRPTSLMGASKRLAERLIIERPKKGTRFKAVRFGNVLGSSGSVIPIFREQIRQGGPVTVTSREVTRYFMTIPEAVELVIVAGTVGEDRGISVLEMGDPVKIDSLARRMIELSGFVPDVDIEIQYVGLRPGEKEYEELLTDDEGVVRTDHDRIWVVEQSQEVDAPPLDVAELMKLLDEGNAEEIRKFADRNIPGSLLFPE